MSKRRTQFEGVVVQRFVTVSSLTKSIVQVTSARTSKSVASSDICAARKQRWFFGIRKDYDVMVVASRAPSPVYWTGLVQWRSCWLVTDEEPVSKYWRYISYCHFCFSVFLQYHQMWQNSSTVNMARQLLFVFLRINLSWLSSHPFGSCVRLRNSGDGENLVFLFYYIICWRHISCHVSVAWEGGEGRRGEGRGGKRCFV